MSKSTDLATLARASNPAPSAIERGAPARMHWRAGLAVDAGLRALATDGSLSPEWSAVLAETHARLLDPAGVRPLPTPSPIGAAVGRALEADPSWAGLVAASSLHPTVARDTVSALAPLVRGALVGADAAKLDSRRSLEGLQAARARLEAARAAVADTKAKAAAGDMQASFDLVQHLGESVQAAEVAERASASYQQASAAADRAGARIAQLAPQLATLAAEAETIADGLHAVMACGLGHALGASSASEVPSEVVEALSPDVVKLMKLVGSLRMAIREGRATRHLPGREGMLGPDLGGIDRVADARPLTLVGLAGGMGEAMRLLTLLQLAQGRASVVEKGGGRANNGHLALVVDQSGSMRGDRALWANGLALAMTLEALTQRRSVVIVAFAEDVRGTVVVDGPTALRAAFALICRESNGSGTNVPAALAAALVGLQRLPQGGKSADAVLVTDGAWNASDVAGWPTGAGAPALQGVFIGGAAPAGTKLAAAWSVEASADLDAGGGLAVTIAKTVL